MIDNANIVAALIALFGGSVTAYVTIKVTARSKARFSSTEAEIKSRAEYVTMLQSRVGDLESRLDDIGQRSIGQIERMDKMDSRWRHLTNNLVQYISALRNILDQNNLPTPMFSGWEAFLRDGGEIREEWRSHIDPP